jgi:cell division protein FtsQ
LRLYRHHSPASEPPRSRRGWGAIGVAIAVLGAASAVVGFSGLPRGGGSLVDDIVVASGFGIEQISLVGHRFTTDAQLYAALMHHGARSQFSFDAEAARLRVEALPWIDKARVSRVLPSGIRVEMTERQAVAVWLDGDAHVLVDATGRRLARVPASALAELPRITGAGAPAAVGQLLQTLALHPGIRSRMEFARRQGERRWTLELAPGVTVHLPEHDLGPALQRLADLDAANELKSEGRLIVDLRHPRVTALRTEPAESVRVRGTAKSTGRTL